MALIQCPDCGAKVSDRAKECPHCGCPVEVITGQEKNPSKVSHKSKHHWLVPLLVGMVLLASMAIYALATGRKQLEITPEFVVAIQKYDRLEPFSEGMAAVRRNGKWGYINLRGEEVIPCQFSDAFPPGQFAEGVACVVDSRNEEPLWNSRVGFINKEGEWVIEGDFYTEAPNLSEVWAQTDHQLPSFRDGKCAVYSKPVKSVDNAFDANPIVLVDHKGHTTSAPDSIARTLIAYHPYMRKEITEWPRSIQVYDDYYLSELRDTMECDNGAKIVYWSILDANSYPYDTGEVSVCYLLDSNNNSTLTSDQTSKMNTGKEALITELTSRHATLVSQREEQERRQREEEKFERERAWLCGTWEYSGTVDFGRYLGGVKKVTSRLIITPSNIQLINNGERSYSGSYSVENDQIVFDRKNGSATVLPLHPSSQQIEFHRGRYYKKISSGVPVGNYTSGQRSSGGYLSSSSSSSFSEFYTDQDVWTYLSDLTFEGHGTSFRLTPQYLIMQGQSVTGGIRVLRFSRNSAILTASSPYLGGHTFTMYLDASRGTITSDGLTYYAR